jgi:hypothetical protein
MNLLNLKKGDRFIILEEVRQHLRIMQNTKTVKVYIKINSACAQLESTKVIVNLGSNCRVVKIE